MAATPMTPDPLPGRVPAARRVFLVRHGQTDLNVRRIVQGPRVDSALSAIGREQARAVARRLLPEPLAAVYASPMLRARDTAKAIADVHGLPVRILAGLTEYDWGLYCGREESGDTAAAMQSVFDRWWAGDLDARPADGESAREAEMRVRAAFASALAEAPGFPPNRAGAAAQAPEASGGDRAGAAAEAPGAALPEPPAIAIVAHGRINKILLASLLTGDLRRQEDFPQFNTAVTLLEEAAEVPRPDPLAPAHLTGSAARWTAAYVNDTSHRIGVDIPVGKEVRETNA